MDPKSSEAFKEALSQQGQLLGQHDKMLQGIMESLQTLHLQLNQLSTQIPPVNPSTSDVGPPAPVSSSESVPPPQPPAPSKEPFVPSPEPYSGDLGSCSQFILSCSLVFDLQPLSYPSDKAKIAYMVNLLRGRAAKWATALWNGASPVLNSFDSFKSELCKVFDHPVKGREAARRLLTMSQGSQSAANYSIEFRILSSECGWDEPALRGIYVKGLSEQLKDELATRDEPSTLEELISLSIRIDNRLRERVRERTTRSHRLASPFESPAPPAPMTPLPVLPPASPLPPEEPMQLGRARLTPQERQRRMQRHLCLYCGEADHFIASCPSSPKEKAHH